MRPVRIKFCGLMRPEDARQAAMLGADFAGVVFAAGPRRLDAARATEVLDAAGMGIRRVGVFGEQSTDEIARLARRARLDIVQLHADPTARQVMATRAVLECDLWAVARVSGSRLPDTLADVIATADAVVLDARVPGRLGGTGTALDWHALAEPLARVRGNGCIVLAGGLAPENVESAVAALQPDVVDVSSGVERAPGIKDHARMRDFRDAVRQARERS